MTKLMSIILASTLALLGVTSLAGAAGTSNSGQNKGTSNSRQNKGTSNTRQNKIAAVVPVLGPAVPVPVGQFVKAFAYCPKGYYVTGGGAYNGAITEIASSPTKDLRGWFVDGTNNDPMSRTFQHRADAVCVKGNPPLSALTAAAANARLVHQAELEFTARQQTGGRG
jgi:hypothetical protein